VVNWFISFAVGLVFVQLADAIGQGRTFWCFATVCAVGFWIIGRFVPETKGRSFGEIASDLHGRLGARARPSSP
jgi:SP family galactose:H+ symporter-like MFS transporter